MRNAPCHTEARCSRKWLPLQPAQQAGVSPGQSQNAPDPLSLLDDAAPGGDFLDDLLGGDAKGPGKIATPDPMDELLPPLDDDDPFFAKPKDVHQDMGASDPMHNPSPSDAFAAPRAEGGANLIPDDWDSLLEPDEVPLMRFRRRRRAFWKFW